MKTITNYPNYAVTRQGLVIDLRTNESVNIGYHGGYKTVWLRNEDGGKSFSVHRLVALVFIPNRFHLKCREVNHIDSNKLNNDVTNLEWCTHQENINHAVQAGRFASRITGYSQRNHKRLKTPLEYITPHGLA